MTDDDSSVVRRRGKRLAAGGVIAALGVMTALTWSAPALYDLFCRVTGYGGTPRVAGADAAPEATNLAGGYVRVRFDANVAAGLPWRFEAPRAVDVLVGETRDIAYTARNLSGGSVTGRAVFNVSPPQAAYVFTKIHCFCFEEQTLAPGEEARMPVVFFVDPEIKDDPELSSVRVITLSYTFFPS